jgi:hypothetical protein
VFADSEDPIAITYLYIPVDEETHRKRFPQLMPRYEAILRSLQPPGASLSAEVRPRL